MDGGHQKKIFEQKTIRGVGETEAVKIVSRKSHQLSFWAKDVANEEAVVVKAHEKYVDHPGMVRFCIYVLSFVNTTTCLIFFQ